MGDLSANKAAADLEVTRCFSELERAIDRLLTCHTAPDPQKGGEDWQSLDAKLRLIREQLNLRWKVTADRGFRDHTKAAFVRRGIQQLMGFAAQRAKLLNL